MPRALPGAEPGVGRNLPQHVAFRRRGRGPRCSGSEGRDGRWTRCRGARAGGGGWRAGWLLSVSGGAWGGRGDTVVNPGLGPMGAQLVLGLAPAADQLPQDGLSPPPPPPHRCACRRISAAVGSEIRQTATMPRHCHRQIAEALKAIAGPGPFATASWQGKQSRSSSVPVSHQKGNEHGEWILVLC